MIKNLFLLSNIFTYLQSVFYIYVLGLMICCEDEHLNEDAIKYLNEFTRLNVHIAISHICGLPCKYSLQINPYILVDAIIAILTNEKETISDVGKIAIGLVMKELQIILGVCVCMNILLSILF